MKLRVALCAAVLLSGAAAFAQPRPWQLGLYDKLRPHDVPVPQPFADREPSSSKPNNIVVFVPAELKKPLKVALPTNQSEAGSYRANYFKLQPPKSPAH